MGRWAGRQRAAYAVVVLSSALVAACGQPQKAAPDVLATVSVPIQPTITAIGTEPVVPVPDPSAPAVDGLYDFSDHLTTASCAAANGVWSYSGTLKNPEDTALTITVAIILVQTTDMSSVETKEVTVTVQSGGTVPVTAKAFYTSQATDLECLTGATVKGS